MVQNVAPHVTLSDTEGSAIVALANARKAHSLRSMSNHWPPAPGKKKVDYAALQSPLNRIPAMDLKTVRDLLDLGIGEVDDLRGRAPEVLMEEICNLRPETPRSRLASLRMAVYYAESEEPDPALMQPHRWLD